MHFQIVHSLVVPTGTYTRQVDGCMCPWGPPRCPRMQLFVQFVQQTNTPLGVKHSSITGDIALLNYATTSAMDYIFG